MIRVLLDENFNGHILTGLRNTLPEVEAMRAQDTPIAAANDPDLLQWAYEQSLVLLTHDKKTIPGFVKERLDRGEQIAGVVIVDQSPPFSQTIDDLATLIYVSSQDEWIDRLEYL